MSKYQNLIATVLVCIAMTFVSTSMLWAKSILTTDQEKAKSKCALKYMFCVDECVDAPCQRKCEFWYNKCMDDAGIPRQENPPPKTGAKLTPTKKPTVPASKKFPHANKTSDTETISR